MVLHGHGERNQKLLITNFNSYIMASLPPEEYIKTPPKVYAVIYAVAGLYEGYSDTTCEFFPTREAAQKHIKQHMALMSEDKRMVQDEIDPSGDATYYLTDDYEDYAVCKADDEDMEDWLSDNDATCEVLRIYEVDASRYENSSTTEHMWLTWDQQDCCVAWDYYPLCMSLVARVTSDVMDNTNDDHPTQALHDMAQLGEFISAVYYRNEAFIDIDDYTMHAFRIPKKIKTDE